MDADRRYGLVLGASLLLALGGVALDVSGTTADHGWDSYGVQATLPSPPPLSPQVMRGAGAAVAPFGAAAALWAVQRLAVRRRGRP